MKYECKVIVSFFSPGSPITKYSHLRSMLTAYGAASVEFKNLPDLAVP
jgi:hypothetical protein